MAWIGNKSGKHIARACVYALACFVYLLLRHIETTNLLVVKYLVDLRESLSKKGLEIWCGALADTPSHLKSAFGLPIYLFL